jgi:hypothetical protein
MGDSDSNWSEEDDNADDTTSLIISGGGCLQQIQNPMTKLHRYFVLFFICFLTFGPYFCYVLPGAIQSQIEKTMGITTTEFSFFASLYSWPNIIICFMGGFLIDNILGVRFGTIVFSILVTIGQFLFSLGPFSDSVACMYIGRFIFGY